MADKQEKKEFEMDSPFKEVLPPAMEKAWKTWKERRVYDSRERTPEEKERLMKMAEILEEDMKRRGFRSSKENEQNK